MLTMLSSSESLPTSQGFCKDVHEVLVSAWEAVSKLCSVTPCHQAEDVAQWGGILAVLTQKSAFRDPGPTPKVGVVEHLSI